MIKKILLLLATTVLTLSCEKETVEKDPFAECKEQLSTEEVDLNSYSNVKIYGDSIAIINGDIIIDVKVSNGKATAITGKGSGRALWPKGIIPYYFVSDFPEETKEVVRRGFEQSNNLLITKMVEYPNRLALQEDLGRDQHYVYIKSFPFASASYVGMRTTEGSGKGQSMLFQPVEEEFIPIHERGHCEGFWHEHNRIDREQNIIVHWDNIYEGAKDQFDIDGDTRDIGEFDFSSIMLYNSWHYSKNGEVTLTKKDSSTWETNKILSQGDIEANAIVYKCEVWKRDNQ